MIATASPSDDHHPHNHPHPRRHHQEEEENDDEYNQSSIMQSVSIKKEDREEEEEVEPQLNQPSTTSPTNSSSSSSSPTSSSKENKRLDANVEESKEEKKEDEVKKKTSKDASSSGPPETPLGTSSSKTKEKSTEQQTMSPSPPHVKKVTCSSTTPSTNDAMEQRIMQLEQMVMQLQSLLTAQSAAGRGAPLVPMHDVNATSSPYPPPPFLPATWHHDTTAGVTTTAAPGVSVISSSLQPSSPKHDNRNNINNGSFTFASSGSTRDELNAPSTPTNNNTKAPHHHILFDSPSPSNRRVISTNIENDGTPRERRHCSSPPHSSLSTPPSSPKSSQKTGGVPNLEYRCFTAEYEETLRSHSRRQGKDGDLSPTSSTTSSSNYSINSSSSSSLRFMMKERSNSFHDYETSERRLELMSSGDNERQQQQQQQRRISSFKKYKALPTIPSASSIHVLSGTATTPSSSASVDLSRQRKQEGDESFSTGLDIDTPPQTPKTGAVDEKIPNQVTCDDSGKEESNIFQHSKIGSSMKTSPDDKGPSVTSAAQTTTPITGSKSRPMDKSPPLTGLKMSQSLSDLPSTSTATPNKQKPAKSVPGAPPSSSKKEKKRKQQQQPTPSISAFFSFFKNDVLNLDARHEDGSGTEDVDANMEEFLRVPSKLESLLLFGLTVCVDSFLYVITFLPLKFIWAVLCLFCTILRPRRGIGGCQFHRRHFYQLLQVFVIYTIYSRVLCPISIGKLYHWIRGQAMIKIYVIIAMVEVFDRLMCSLGQDAFDSLYWNTTRRPHHFRMVVSTLVVLVYVALHSLILLLHVATLNVAMNSADQALLTLLISGNFAEIKSTVFKKYNKQNLFKITTSDICERFKLALFLSLILILNCFQGGMDQSMIHAYINVCVIVLAAEMLADWIKHMFITKFNFIKSNVYNDYALILAGDVSGIGHEGLNLDHTHAVVKRVGLAQIPLVCVMARYIREAARYALAYSVDMEEDHWWSFISKWYLDGQWGVLAGGVLVVFVFLMTIKIALGVVNGGVAQRILDNPPIGTDQDGKSNAGGSDGGKDQSSKKKGTTGGANDSSDGKVVKRRQAV